MQETGRPPGAGAAPAAPGAVRQHAPGLILALLSWGLILLWVGVSKPLNAPDEPAHLQAILQVRKQHQLPEVHYEFVGNRARVVSPPTDPTVRAYAQQVGRRGEFPLIPYESMQAPLYYVVTGVAALPLPPDPQTVLYLGRVIAALFGAGTVYFCWAAGRVLAPQAPAWAIASAAAVALLPQFCFNSATAANDSAFNCASAAAFYVWLRALRDPAYDPWLLRAGAVLGLAVLTKLTGLALAPGLGVLLLVRLAGAPPGGSWGAWWPRAVRLTAGAAGGTLAVCGWWLLRNLLVYGEVTGGRDAFHFYHIRFQQFDWTSAAQRAAFLEQTWESLWGRFGWMSIRLDPGWYTQTRYVALILLIVSLVALVRARPRLPGRALARWPFAWQAGLVFASVGLAIALGYWQYNVTVNFQAQGRYFFALLLPAAWMGTGGLYTLLPGRARVVALGLLLLWLGILNAAGLAALG
ncbi:MAG TPA: glycosyltransferase family 39 protein [Chloroflexia bacterium]|nr:glycosyltransferase family 39 protein [Chloroflexia bacterium]